MWNFTVIPKININEANICNFDVLAIPDYFEEGGFYNDAYNEDFLNLIGAFDIIASICVEVLPINKSDILPQRNATTYNLPGSIRCKYY